MGPHQRYNHFASGYGAGRDKLGHMVFSGQGYVSPSEKGKMLSHMNSLAAEVASDNEARAADQANAYAKRSMAMQDEDRAFQKNMMSRQADLAGRKLGILQGLIRRI